MYHIGKVIHILHPEEKGSKFADQTSQALVEMWDDNLIIFKINPMIAKDIKENDYVSVDYSPIAVGGAPVPKHEIFAIINESKGKKIVQKLKEKIEQKNPKMKNDEQQGVFHGKMIG